MTEEFIKDFWRGIKHFDYYEFSSPEDPESGLKMDFSLIQGLDELREKTGHPIWINHNGGFATHGHSDGSYHYEGRGADFHFDWPDLPFQQQAKLVFNSPAFRGIGLYPGWVHPGFHVDTRLEPFQVWVEREGKYIYLFQ